MVSRVLYGVERGGRREEGRGRREEGEGGRMTHEACITGVGSGCAFWGGGSFIVPILMIVLRKVISTTNSGLGGFPWVLPLH